MSYTLMLCVLAILVHCMSSQAHTQLESCKLISPVVVDHLDKPWRHMHGVALEAKGGWFCVRVCFRFTHVG